jgi:hypothetical protein
VTKSFRARANWPLPQIVVNVINNGLADPGMRARHFFDSDIFGGMENRRLH